MPLCPLLCFIEVVSYLHKYAGICKTRRGYTSYRGKINLQILFVHDMRIYFNNRKDLSLQMEAYYEAKVSLALTHI